MAAPLTVEEVKAQRERQREEENKILEALHHSVLRTKDHAERAGQELDDQDKMLDRLRDGVGVSHGEMAQQQRSIGYLLEHSNHKGFMAIVCILLLVIVILLWI